VGTADFYSMLSSEFSEFPYLTTRYLTKDLKKREREEDIVGMIYMDKAWE
jgi:hypothetical protein